MKHKNERWKIRMRKCLNIRYEDEGYGIVVPLKQINKDKKYNDYSVSCHYMFKKNIGKYSLKMWLKQNDIDGKFGMVFEGIDEQLVSGTPQNIREHICRIVEQMVHNGYIDKFIDRFEFDMLCCEKGFEILNNLKYKEDPESV